MTRLKTFPTTLIVLGTLLILGSIRAAFAADPVRREIAFPDLPDYQTLACDFHMHTVFSDGAVWPTVRVNEAWRQGLDAIAITDHVEYQPHKDDVPTQHNRPYDIAAGAARARVLPAAGAAPVLVGSDAPGVQPHARMHPAPQKRRSESASRIPFTR